MFDFVEEWFGSVGYWAEQVQHTYHYQNLQETLFGIDPFTSIIVGTAITAYVIGRIVRPG